MKQKDLSRLIIGLCLAVILTLGGTTWYFARQAGDYRLYIDNGNKRAFSQLLQSMGNIDTALQKIKYAGSGPLLATLSAEVWRECETAKAAMADLPTNGATLEKYERFIAQTGDFSYAILRMHAAGGAVSDEHREALVSLSSVAGQLSAQISQLKEQIDAGEANIGGITMSQDAGALVTDDMSETERDFPEYSSLIYDGPFSEHINSLTPKLLEGKEEIGREAALSKAKAFLDRPVSLELQHESAGIIPYYCFSDGFTTSVEVTKAGGHILSMSDTREIETAALEPEQAIEAAEAFLQSHGFEHLKTSYYTKFESIVTVNFAYTIGEVIVYSDLIKVGVALDDGSIVRLDAAGYVMNHHQRTLDAPAVGAEEARSVVPDELEAVSVNLALVPTAGKNEVLCHEFVCRAGDESNVIVYVNAKTGLQENILLLIESSNGVLTR